MLQRSEHLASVRKFFRDRGVVEVQTPVLGRDTVTDPDVEGISVPGYGYLQTSPEDFLKRLLAAGFPDCYQMGPSFRADEQGRLHNQEFTLLEWYRLNIDHYQLMDEVSGLVDTILGPTAYETVGYEALVGDLDRPRDELDIAFSTACESLSGRVFVTDYPADQAALARLNEDGSAARFELIVDGVEIANGYWELLDANEHRERFASDLAARASRGLPSRGADAAFLAALDAGLPTCSGVALGIDRLVMIACGATSLDDVLSFRA